MASTGHEQTPMKAVIKSLLALRDDTTTFNCVIKCKKQEFFSHHLVLRACSPYFYAAFAVTNQDESPTVIDLREFIEDVAMKVILDYMYTGVIPNISANVDVLQAVVSASRFLKMDDLFRLSLEVLSEKLSATNIAQLLQLSLDYADDRLESKIISHLKNKICHLALREDFLALSSLHVKKILTHFAAQSEYKNEIRRAFTAWINIDNERQRDFPSLHIPLTTIRSGNKMESSTYEMDGTGKNKQTSEEVTFVESQHVLIFRFNDGHKRVMTYDVEKNNWSTWKNFPVDVNEDGVTVVYRNHLYFMGGWINKTELLVSSMIYDYCLNMNILSSTSQLRFPVVHGSAAVLHDQIYVVGGWGGRRVQRYDIAKRDCQEVARTNEKYLRSRMVSFNNFLYVADKSTIYAGNLERYDPKTDQWTFITSINIEWFNIAFSGCQMFVMGPYADATLNVYDLATNVWLPRISFTNGPNGIYGLWSAVKGNRPILIAQSRDRLWYTYDIQSSTWEMKLHSPSLYEDYMAVVVAKLMKPSTINQSEHPVLSSLNYHRKSLNLTDVTLKCGSQKIGAHRIVLSAALPYFQTMFSSGFSEANSKIVRFPNVRAEVMEVVLTFLYAGTIQKDTTQDLCFYKELLEVCHLMQIKELYNIAIQKLATQLTMINFQEIEGIADIYDCPVLKCLVSTLLARNFPVLVQSDDFLLVSVQQLKRVLQHPEFEFSLEPSCTVERLLQWCQYDLKSREPVLRSVISTLGLKVCSEKKSNLLKTVKKLVERIRKPELALDYAICIIRWLEYDLRNAAEKESLVSVYDPNTKKIAEYNGIPLKLVNGMSAVGFGCYVYFFGEGNVNSDSARLIYQYCPFSNAIISQGTLKLPVTTAGAGVLDDTIYIIDSSSVQRYTPACASCEVISKTIHAHSKPLVFSCNSNIIVFSCCDVQQDAIIEQYIPLSDQWSVVTKVPYVNYPDQVPHYQLHRQSNYIAVRNEIFYLGTKRCITKCEDNYYGRPGDCGSQRHYVTEIYRYDFNTCKWSVTQIEQCSSVERRYSSQMPLEETILLEGGFPSFCGLTRAEIIQWCRIACLSQKCQVLFTDRIQGEFAFPILLRLNPLTQVR